MRVVYVTNRGGTHPNRRKYFDSIRADYQYVDFKMRWHGLNLSGWRMLVSGILCAIQFPQRKKYDLFVSSDPQLTVVLMRVFGLLRRDQKIAVYLGSQTLYFINDGYFSRYTALLYKFLLRKYDYYICNGPMQAQLLKDIIAVAPSKIFININGLNDKLRQKLNSNQFAPGDSKIVFIGNLYSDWRLYYKGIDLLLGAFVEVSHTKDLRLFLIGDYDDSLVNMISSIVPERLRQNINIIGKSQYPEEYFTGASLYLHPSRGDALPNSLLEAMGAGVPVVISEWTGWREIVGKIDKKLICSLNVPSLTDAIRYYLNLPTEVKNRYSARFREESLIYSESHAIEKFKSIVSEIYSQ